MKAFYPAFGVVLLAFGVLWYVGAGNRATQTVAAAERSYISEPMTHENLTVFFVHGPDAVADTQKVATLQEALDAGWAVVHETGNVNELAVENRSDDTELFIQEGDIIKGGQQDRTFAIDMLVPPKSGVVPFPAHCVEQGRWQGRGQESATQFNKSDQRIVGNKLAYANATRQQSAVWDNVKENQDKLTKSLKTKVNGAESETSFQLTLENKDLQAKIGEFEKALRSAGENRKNVLGVVFLVNGKITGAEVYGSQALFQKAWPKLLRSQAADAVAEATDKPLPPTMSVQEVERFLAMANEADAKPVANPDAVSPANGGERVPQQQAGIGRARAVQQVQLNNPRLPEPGTQQGRIPPMIERLLPPEMVPQAQVQELQVDNVRSPYQTQMQQRAGLPNSQPLNRDGNRLNVNRVENATGLVSESRDPARQNAVIHRSYIKK